VVGVRFDIFLELLIIVHASLHEGSIGLGTWLTSLVDTLFSQDAVVVSGDVS
jgi:hypothetical protein